MKNTTLRFEEEQRNISIHIQPLWKPLTKSWQNCCLNQWILKSFKTVDDEFDHIVKISQGVFRSNDQYENHPYVDEFIKACNVMFVYGTYVLEGEVDGNFFWVIYGIYFRETLYQTMQAIFAGK